MMRPLVACGVVLLGCANIVPQDRATGPDGKLKGAKPIALQEGEGRARGIVTYPGGDRVDWKLIELPEGRRGTLDLQMTFTTPRPGLRVAFDVFDQWNTPVVAATARGRGRVRSAKIDRASGTYFVRVYAPRRGDAGTYQLVAEFTPDPDKPTWDPLSIPVPLPPKLPAVPDAPIACTTHDPGNPECEKTCAPGAPSTWKGCPQPSTTATVQPPTPPTPPPAPPAQPQTVRIVKIDTVGGELEVTLPVGSSAGVTTAWRAHVLRGGTNAPLPGGAATIVRVTRNVTIVRLKATIDQLNANPNVTLTP